MTKSTLPSALRNFCSPDFHCFGSVHSSSRWFQWQSRQTDREQLLNTVELLEEPDSFLKTTVFLALEGEWMLDLYLSRIQRHDSKWIWMLHVKCKEATVSCLLKNNESSFNYYETSQRDYYTLLIERLCIYHASGAAVPSVQSIRQASPSLSSFAMSQSPCTLWRLVNLLAGLAQ